MLLLQSALPVAPPVDYFLHVFSPIAKKMGVETECFVDKR